MVSALVYGQADSILVMDDDNYAKPEELEKLLLVRDYTNADIVSCGDDYFSGESNPMPEQAAVVQT